MAISDVTELRKAGKYNEAYALALRELNEDPNEWTKMSMFWVLRDYTQKVYMAKGEIQNAISCLNQMKQLLPGMIDDSGAGERAYNALCKHVLPGADFIKKASELSKTDPITAYDSAIKRFGKTGYTLDAGLHEDFGWIIYRYLKKKSESLTSVENRGLLRDYMMLKNDRPSLLHSMILNFALNFAKSHPDFSFYKFFVMWGVGNLRYEDYANGYSDGKEIPSLISRICRTIIDSEEEFDVNIFVDSCGYHSDKVAEHLRQSYFWYLMNLQKNGNYAKLWDSFERYSFSFSNLGESHWNSEILKIAHRFMIDGDAFRLIPFIKQWNIDNLRDKDWEKETSDDGKAYPSLAVKLAKRCYENIKVQQNKEELKDDIKWLKQFYAMVVERDTDDDWSNRNYATICKWNGDIDEAIGIYKELLLDMSEKYYLWSELAELVSEPNIKLGLLLKALRLERNEDFLGEIHLSTAEILLEMGYHNSTLVELDKYSKHRGAKGWSMSDKYRELSNKVNRNNDTESFVDTDYIFEAENFVFSNYDWSKFVMVDRWRNDGVERCSFTNKENQTFQIKLKRFPELKAATIGEVVEFRCQIKEEHVQDPKYPLYSYRKITIQKVIPLVVRISNEEKWSILESKYGVVDYVNKEKSTLHIISTDSVQVFVHTNTSKYTEGDFVCFKTYKDKRKDEMVTRAANVTKCDKNVALKNFQSHVVVVDDVNTAKNLFHVVLGSGLISDVVMFSQTSIRPNIGDFLRITYYVKKNKDGKKRIKFLNVQTTDEVNSNVARTIDGTLVMKYHNPYDEYEDDSEPDFAFIGDYYVHKKLLRKYKITKDCHVKAKAVLGGDNKWKVYELILGN